ncbi:hypothetical protein [Amycolatopsis sp. NBC_01286]|uniref:hypothetical protein n=1 Tax=Amycolatopsis sp. NBC_01286 TaxID=2903560 RepID=UPI002E14D9BA|nr:hypothetical protein OG570_12435 [Amycolatopsis sp. NBC_01286]
MSKVTKKPAGRVSDDHYLTSIRSAERDAFLDGKLTLDEYLEYARKVAHGGVMASKAIAVEDQRLRRASRLLAVFSRLTFFFLAPVAYLVIGVVAIFNHPGSAIGWLSVTTAAVVVAFSGLFSRWLRKSESGVMSHYFSHGGSPEA